MTAQIPKLITSDMMVANLLKKLFDGREYKIFSGYQDGVNLGNEYIVVYDTGIKPLSTGHTQYDSNSQTKITKQLVSSDIQVDIYGNRSNIDVLNLQTILWSSLASDYLQANFGAGVLQVQNPQNLTDVFDSDSYKARYSISFSISYMNTVYMQLDSSNQVAGFELINIDINNKQILGDVSNVNNSN